MARIDFKFADGFDDSYKQRQQQEDDLLAFQYYVSFISGEARGVYDLHPMYLAQYGHRMPWEVWPEKFGHLKPAGNSNLTNEQEADKLAKQVVNGETADPIVANKNNSTIEPKTPPGFESTVQNRKSSGENLPDQLRQEMETKLGADFSGVKIHNTANDNALAAEAGAQAFTSGQDIVFGKGKFDPDSTKGKELLAHELVHAAGGNEQGNKLGIQRSVDPYKTYTVQANDTLAKLIIASGVSEEQILLRNKFILGRPGKEVIPGELLYLPLESAIGIQEEKPDPENATDNTIPVLQNINNTVTENTEQGINEKTDDKVPVLPAGVHDLTWGTGLYYEKEVDALFITADSYNDAVRYTRTEKYPGFWYYVNAQTGWMSMIQQKDAVEKYNQMYYSFSVELIDEINIVANDPVLRENAVKSGTLGNDFIALVKKAQEILFGPGYTYAGMYDPRTRKLVNEEKERQRNAEDAFTSGEFFEARYGLTPFYSEDKITPVQIGIINSLSDTMTLWSAYNKAKRHLGKYVMIERVLKYKNQYPTWTYSDWKFFIDHQQEPKKKTGISYMHNADSWPKDPELHGYYAAQHFFKGWTHSGANVDAIEMGYDAGRVLILYLIFELEATKTYGGVAGGRIDDLEEFNRIVSIYAQHLDEGGSFQSHTAPGEIPVSFHSFYDRYLWTRTFDYFEEGKADMQAEMGRYGVVEGDYIGEGPEIQALMDDLQHVRSYYLRAQEERDKVPPHPANEYDEPHKNNDNYIKSNELENDGYHAFNQLRTKYPILLSKEFGEQQTRKSPNDPVSYEGGEGIVKRFVWAASNDATGRKNTISTLFGLYQTRKTDIEKLKQKLYEKPYRIWQLQRAIDRTMAELNFAQGSVFDHMIESWQKEGIEEDQDYITLIGTIGFGILSAFFPVFIPFSIAFSLKQFSNDLDKTEFEHAATNTSFDPKEDLSNVVPSSYWWLVLDAAGIVLDGVEILQFLRIGTKAARSVNMLRKMEGEVEKLVIDANNLDSYIENVTAIVKAQVKDEKAQQKFIKHLTNEKTLRKIVTEDLARKSLIESKAGIPLSPKSQLLKSFLADGEPLQELYKAGMYRAMEIEYPVNSYSTTSLFSHIDEYFAWADPDIAKQLLKIAGESKGMADKFSYLCNAVKLKSGGAFTMDDFIAYELRTFASDNRQLFRNLDDYNVNQAQIDEAVEKVKNNPTSGSAVRMLHDELVSIVNNNKISMRQTFDEGIIRNSKTKVMSDVNQQIEDATNSATVLKSKTEPVVEVNNAGRPAGISEDFRATKIDEYGESLVNKTDNAFASNSTKAESLSEKYGAQTVYDEALRNGGNLDAAEKTLDQHAWSEWYEHGINSETRKALTDDNIWVIYRNMDPRTRKLLTLCASVCIPTKITQLQTSRINKIINDFNLTGDEMNLREYLHRTRDKNNTTALDVSLDKMEDALYRLPVGASYDDVFRTIDDELEQLLVNKASSLGYNAVKTNRGWVLTQINPPNNAIAEYQRFATYNRSKTDNYGLEGFFQGHHGVQGQWAKIRLEKNILSDKSFQINGKSIFEKNDLYDYDLAPVINLRDTYAGTPHQRITLRQNSRSADRASRTYMDERLLAEEDLRIAEVPEDIIQEVLLENDAHYRIIYNKIETKLNQNKNVLKLSDDDINNYLLGIFGTKL